MESTLCFRYSSLSNLPLRVPVPSAVNATRVTKPCFNFRHSSLLLSNASERHPLGHVVSPITCTLDGFQMYSTIDKSDTKKARGMGGVPLVLACVLGIITCSCKISSKALAKSGQNQPPLVEKFLATTMGSSAFDGRAALKSLLGVSEYTASRKDEPPHSKKKVTSTKPSELERIEVSAIKEGASLLMNAGKGDQAVKLLKAYVDYVKDPVTSYDAEMALVEILIRQGKYDEAKNCKCLDINNKNRPPGSDSRFHLYRALVYALSSKGNKEVAKKSWEEFIEAVEGGSGPVFPGKM